MVKIQNIVISYTSDHIKREIKMPNPSQEPPASSKAPKEDSKDVDVLCTFKIKIESKKLEYWCINNHWTDPNKDQDTKPQSWTSSILQSPKWGLQGHGCPLHLQIKIESPNLDYGCVNDQWLYPNEDEDAKPQSGASSPHQSPKSGLKGYGCSLHLQYQDREPTFLTRIYQRPVTISELRSRCQTPVRNLQR